MGSELGKRKSRRTEMSLDKATGRWCAKLGRKKTKSGNTDGHKFRFTEDLKESERRKLRIQQLWDRLVEQRGRATHGMTRTWQVALAMAEGKCEVSFSVEQLAPEELPRTARLLGSRNKVSALRRSKLRNAFRISTRR